MSGVAIIRGLLVAHAPLIAIVPAARIVAGDLSLYTAMPSIIIEQVDSRPHHHIRTNESPKLYTDHVQVSVLVKGPQGTPAGLGYPQVRSLLRLVLAACPSQRGTVNGFAVESIIPDGEAGDLPPDETNMYSGSLDFFVNWWAP